MLPVNGAQFRNITSSSFVPATIVVNNFNNLQSFLGGGYISFFGILASNRTYSVLLGAVPEILSLCKLATASAILLPINSPVDSAVLVIAFFIGAV